MGSSRSGGEFAGKIRTAGTNLRQSKTKAVKSGADTAARVLRSTPGVPSKVAGKPVGVRTRMLSDDTAIVRFTGPAHLVDRPTKPHNIFPKKFVGTRGRGKKAQKGASLLAAFGVNARSGSGGVKLKDGSVRRMVHHPGTRGKHFFDHGKGPAMQAARKDITKSVVSEFGKSFK